MLHVGGQNIILVPIVLVAVEERASPRGRDWQFCMRFERAVVSLIQHGMRLGQQALRPHDKRHSCFSDGYTANESGERPSTCFPNIHPIKLIYEGTLEESLAGQFPVQLYTDFGR